MYSVPFPSRGRSAPGSSLLASCAVRSVQWYWFLSYLSQGFSKSSVPSKSQGRPVAAARADPPSRRCLSPLANPAAGAARHRPARSLAPAAPVRGPRAARRLREGPNLQRNGRFCVIPFVRSSRTKPPTRRFGLGWMPAALGAPGRVYAGEPACFSVTLVEAIKS